MKLGVRAGTRLRAQSRTEARAKRIEELVLDLRSIDLRAPILNGPMG